jgi:hypothetical protein
VTDHELVPIWGVVLDDAYHANVYRTQTPQRGILTVTLRGEHIASEDVPLAFDPLHGPDQSDWGEWVHLASAIVDRHYRNALRGES